MAESSLGIINRGYVYKIPPAKTITGHRAGDWDLERPLAGPLRVRVVERGDQCVIKLEEPNTNQLFAECVYSDASVMSVLDSSRYFVLTLVDPAGRRAMIGLGFQEKSESFDFNAAIDTFKRYQRQAAEAQKAAEQWASQPQQDLSLGSGTIHISIPTSKPKPKKPETSGGFTGILPPPGSGKLAPPPAAQPVVDPFAGFAPAPPAAATQRPAAGGSNPLDALFGGSVASGAPQQQQQTSSNPFGDDWGDFSSASSSGAAPAGAFLRLGSESQNLP